MPKLTLLQGDALAMLKTLPSDSVHCVCTSPPYYGLRNYGVDGQIGLEPTLDAYLSRLVAVFSEVRRVLHPSGVCFVNMGDSYAGHNLPGWRAGNEEKNGGASNKNGIGFVPGLKPKDRLLVPFRLALLLQADSWWCRDVICWAKRAPMPESVTDRCTQSWEPIFMLTKAARYYWDAEAVKEQTAPEAWHNSDFRRERNREIHPNIGNGERDARSESRNLRNVWLLSPSPYPDAHFATFVPEIPKRCILAGTSAKGVCPKCGEPWVRVVEKTGGTIGKGSWVKDELRAEQGRSQRTGSRADGSDDDGTYQVRTLGWSPGCACDAGPPIPATVLDPFAGTFTTGAVALDLGRHAIGIELSAEYVKLAERRCAAVTPGMALA